MNLSLLSLLPQTKKRKKIQIQSFYLMSMMHFKKPRLFLLQHLKTWESFLQSGENKAGGKKSIFILI